MHNYQVPLFWKIQLVPPKVLANAVTDSAVGGLNPNANVPNGSTYFVGGPSNPPTTQGNGYIATSSTPPGNFVNATSTPTDGTPATITTNLVDYTGASTTVHLTVNGSNQLALTDTGNFASTVSDTLYGNVTLYYTYTPVPEPSKTAAIFIGFGLCLLVGRKYFQGRGGLRLA